MCLTKKKNNHKPISRYILCQTKTQESWRGNAEVGRSTCSQRFWLKLTTSKSPKTLGLSDKISLRCIKCSAKKKMIKKRRDKSPEHFFFFSTTKFCRIMRLCLRHLEALNFISFVLNKALGCTGVVRKCVSPWDLNLSLLAVMHLQNSHLWLSRCSPKTNCKHKRYLSSRDP